MAPPASPRRTLVVAILGSSMAFLDGSVVNVALPVMQRELGITASTAAWIVESYALLLASLVLVGGALGDRFGRRRMFSAGALLFGAASAGCGCAPGAGLLVAARALQGAGAALLVPGSLSLIESAYPPDARGRAFGIWSTVTSVMTAGGPVAGGLVVAHASWRWVFFFNVPLAVATVVLAHGGVEDTRNEGAVQRMDWLGVTLVTAGLGAIVFALLDDGATAGARGEALLLAGGAGALVAFGFVESRAPAAMVPLSLFQSRNFAGTNLLTLLLYGALSGGLYFLPFDLIQVQRYDAAAVGAALLPLVLLVSVLSPVMGSLTARLGTRSLLVAGPLVSAGGFAWLAVPGIGGSYWTTFFPGVAVLGIGMGVTVAPLTVGVMASVDTDRAGVASGVNNAVARTGGLLAVAALGVVLRARFDGALDARLAALRLPAALATRATAERGKLGAADFTDLDDAAQATLRAAFDGAYVAGFRLLMAVSAVLTALGALAALLLIRSRPRR
jgi:EmrB/QacA subfamily drug resistance transporter